MYIEDIGIGGGTLAWILPGILHTYQRPSVRASKAWPADRPGFTMGLAGLKPGATWQAGPRIPSKKIKILLK